MTKQLFFYFLFFLFSIPAISQKLLVVNLRCEYKINPVGVDNVRPGFSWELQSAQQNVLQTGYRVLVADDPSILKNDRGNVWDSKKINSAASIQITYEGKTLQSAKKYFWKVMVWDNKGNVSAWSDEAMWQMGLPDKKDWGNAKWIGYNEINDTSIIIPHVHGNGKRLWGARQNVLPLLRKDFNVIKETKNATAFVCGLGQFELSINGNKVSDHFLDPGWTNYSKHALYVTFDITDKLKRGSNAIGIILGNGFYYIPGQRYRKMTGAFGFPKLVMRIIIEYTDGTRNDIVTDQSWKTAPSPVIFSSIYGGEDYDSNKEQPGWDVPGFNDNKWVNALITNGPSVLQSQMAEPLKAMERFPVVTRSKLKPGVWIYDLGQNFSGVPSITATGRPGDTIRIVPAELLNEDGSANQKGSGGPSYFTYVTSGQTKTWRPRFTYYGFRYLEVRCIPKDSSGEEPVAVNIEGLHIRNAAAAVGTFHCSNDLFNKTYTLINWAIKSNTMSVFTDCPHREKLGWLEETHLMGSSVQYNYDIAALCKKVIRDMMNAQHADGKIPEIAPEFTAFAPPFDESPEWGSAAIILPWYNYLWYGDKETLKEAYTMMKGYVSYLKSKATNNIISHGLGDWFDIGPNRPGVSQMTKMGVTGTATYYYDLTIMMRVAKLLNRTADVKLFEQTAAEVKRSFNQKFFDKQRMQYDSASQTANAMALYMGLVETQYRNAVADALIKDIRSRNNALTAGDVGYRYVLKALEDAGRSDVIYEMNNRDDVPGYGYQLKHGATALTESWQAYPSVSNNHFMLGHLMEWFYGGLCGIKQARNSVAYKKIEIRPQPVGDITSANANFHSPYGDIISEWKKDAGIFEMNVTIPANTTAEIYLPGSRKPVKTGSGNYKYTVKLR